MSVDSRFAAPALASLKDCALDDPRLPTPLFVIDSQKLEKNLRRAKDRAAKLGVAFRPHLKTHKSIGIALRQMTTPQGPATVSTLAEARYFGARGVTDLIYAVGIAPQKLAEVSRLRSLGADIKIILDSAEAARAVSAFCRREKTTIPVLLEIDVDGHRSGIRPDGAELLPAAAALADGAELVGVLTHAGDSYECKSTAEIEAAAEAERAGIVLAAERLRAAGHTVKIVSAGSTPTRLPKTKRASRKCVPAYVHYLTSSCPMSAHAPLRKSPDPSWLPSSAVRSISAASFWTAASSRFPATAARLVRHTITATA